MQRRTTRTIAAASVVLLVTLVASACSEEPAGDGDSQFTSASLELLDVPAEPEPTPAPEPDVSRTMHAAATLSTYTPPLDACRGPVAIDVEEEGRPTLVSEHDYCGGAAWIPALAQDDVVELDGPGVEAGLYEVEVVDTHQRRQAYVEDLRPEADVVLQTCISQSQLILVALTKLPDPVA